MKHPLFQLAHFLAPYRGTVIMATVSSILNKLCDIVPEMLIGISIDVIVNQQTSLVARTCGTTDPLVQLYAVGALTALLWILESVFEYCYLILWRRLAQEVQHNLRMKTYAHLQQLDISFFEDKTTGGLLTIVSDDINELEGFLSQGPNEIIQLTVNIVVMGSIFFCISPTLAILTLLPVPCVIAIAYFFQNRLATLYGTVRDRIASLSGHLASRLIGIMTIKSYSTQSFEVGCLERESLAYKQDNTVANRVNAAYIPIVRMGILCGFIMSLIVGGKLALTGGLSISLYSVLVFLTQRFLWPFTTLTTITDLYERSMASARRVFGLLELTPHIVDGSRRLDVTQVKGAVAFEAVSFAYANGFQVFNNLSLTIPAHTTAAFVGTTGSGKSTIIKLLLRLYDAAQGSVSLDGIDVKALTLDSLRHACALVSQDVYLINDTVAENIAYGSPSATHAQIVKAAQMAEADGFIRQLPDGYATLLGENGKNLSGGQCQRLAIARAIVKNPPIFIFDEATSALDNETEAAVQRAISSLAHQHTMIIIAHRLSTVRHADTIFVIEQGKIVESGSHDELVASNGTYAGLWKIQTGG